MSQSYSIDINESMLQKRQSATDRLSIRAATCVIFILSLLLWLPFVLPIAGFVR